MSQAGVYSSGGPTPPASPPAYGQVYNQGAQDVLAGTTWTFDSNGPLLNISHVLGSDTITVNTAGTYLITWVTDGTGDFQQAQLLVNGVAAPQASFGFGAGAALPEAVGNAIVNLSSGDTVKLKNTGSVDVFLDGTAGYTNASITFEKMPAGGASSGTTTLVGNSGSATEVAGIINVVTANSTPIFSGAGNTLTLDFAGTSNLILGSNTAVAGTNNTGIGTGALTSIGAGSSNTVLGHLAGTDITTGTGNVIIGSGTGAALLSGATNTIIGTGSGSAYSSVESYNICINNTGTALDVGVIRIGTNGVGPNQQSECFIAGIQGNTVSNPKLVTINSVTGQLGVAAGGGTPVDTITGNDGTPESPSAGNFNIVTAGATAKFLGSAATETINFAIDNLVLGSSLPALGLGTVNVGFGLGVLIDLTNGTDNTAIGDSALTTLTTGSFNTAVGSQALFHNTTTNNNTAVGYKAGYSVSTGLQNTFVGSQTGSNGTLTGAQNTGLGYAALMDVTGAASDNTGIGSSALQSLTSGQFNTAVGMSSLLSAVSGSNNVTVGYSSGTNYTGAESNNILIGSSLAGTLGESNVIRIGNGSTTCYIAGIDGVNVGSVARVVTEASNQLGTAIITAGTGITVTSGANTITISASGTSTLTYTSVNSTPYVALTTDEYLGVDCSGGAITIQLPNAPATGRVYIVKDKTGSAATHNITVTTVGGVDLIDGFTTFTMNNNYQSAEFIFNGSAWEIF